LGCIDSWGPVGPVCPFRDVDLDCWVTGVESPGNTFVVQSLWSIQIIFKHQLHVALVAPECRFIVTAQACKTSQVPEANQVAHY
jgi:hypothetical protein